MFYYPTVAMLNLETFATTHIYVHCQMTDQALLKILNITGKNAV